MGEVLSAPTEAVVIRRSDLDAILQTLVSLQAISARAAALLCDRLDLHDAVLDPDSPDFASISDGMPGDPGDHEPGGDEESAAWVEWHTMRGSQKRGPNLTAGHEDDEEDDPSGQCDEDGINTDFGLVAHTPGAEAAGCPISDPDCCIAGDDRVCSGSATGANGGFWHDLGPGSEDDAEHEQMPHDVPMLRVYSAAFNIFNDQRVSLGFSNLQTSFRAGHPVKSADTGNLLMPPREHRFGPGVPV